MLETITAAHHTLLRMLIEQLQNVWVLFFILQFVLLTYNDVSAQGSGGTDNIPQNPPGLFFDDYD